MAALFEGFYGFGVLGLSATVFALAVVFRQLRFLQALEAKDRTQE